MLNYIEPTDNKDLNKFKLSENQLVSAGDSILRIRKRIKIIKNNDSKRRGYLYQCEKCNYIGIRREDQLIKGNHSCPVCTGKECKWNINSIAIKRPDLLPFFVNMEDAYLNTTGSHNKVSFLCPNCRQNVGDKIIKNVVTSGISCPYCGDGIPMGERIFQTACDLANIKYNRQKEFSWSKGYIYDFYLPELNYVVEINGQQHYPTGSSFETVSGLTYEDQHKIDLLKEKLAYDNGIEEVIQISAFNSDFDSIRCAIQGCIYLVLKTEIFDIDWNECEKISSHSMVRICADEWNKGYDASYIKNKYHYGSSSINNWLTQAQKIGWVTDYNKANADLRRGRKIININNLKCYWSPADLANKINISWSKAYNYAFKQKEGYMFFDLYHNNDHNFFMEHLTTGS